MSGNPIRRHPIVTLGIILFIAVAALVAFRLTSGAKTDPRKNRILTVGTMAPIKQDLDVRLTYTADLIPNQLVNIFSRVDGYIAKIYVDKGDLVKAHQLLVEIDHTGVEPTDAQLVLASGVVFMYRTDGVTLRKDLAMLPVGGARSSGLSRAEPNIPADGLRLAGCAEDTVLALSRPGAVLFFQTDPKNSMKPVRYLDTLPVTGVSVLATRDVAAAIPANTSIKYFAVVANGAGSLTLVRLIGSGADAKVDTSTSLGSEVTGGLAVTALALADLDSDGLQDIVLGRDDGSIEWSPQLPSSTEAPIFERAQPLSLAKPLPGGSYATGLSVGNIVGDAAPDLAVATNKSQVFIYSNHR